MKSFTAAAFIGLSSAFEISEDLTTFMGHVAKFNKSYLDHAEFSMRLARFQEVDAFV
jgi:hypothetical protein